MKSAIVFGVFRGMGDLLCAAPVIMAELQQNKAVHLLLFPNPALHEFSNQIDFSPYHQNLYLHAMPDSKSADEWKQFLAEMRTINPETVWISPHAPAKSSSWKIPLVLRTVQLLFWKKAKLVGADSERLSWLFHRQLQVDRSLPLRQREWSAYRLHDHSSLPEIAAPIRFLPDISERRDAPPTYDLVIHPGANAKNRTWPFYKYAPLIAALPTYWRIAFLGLPADMEEIKKNMSPGGRVEYLSGTIRDSLNTIASARLLLLMDSGNMHFAQVLGIPAVAVFGYTDPADIIDLNGCVAVVYEPHLPCQPCRKATCSQPEIYCLNSIEPQTVTNKLIEQSTKMQRTEPQGNLIQLGNNS